MILTANGTITIPVTPGADVQANALGEFDGASVTLETFQDGSWLPVPEAVYTAPFEVVRTNGAASQMRAALTDAGEATSLSITLTEIRR